jgi:hypothetical protein
MRGQEFKQQVAKPVKRGPEENVWFWHPARVGVRHAPEWFLEPLKDQMGQELDVTWNPMIERWLIWTKAPHMIHPICQGWRLLFIHNGPAGEHLPLDERVYARLYASSARAHGSAKAYFDRICAEYERDKERTERRLQQEAVDQAMPYWDHSQIKVSGFGKSNGNKFSTYLA